MSDDNRDKNDHADQANRDGIRDTGGQGKGGATHNDFGKPSGIEPSDDEHAEDDDKAA